MLDVVGPLFEWAYGVWPSYGPAIVAASLVISVFVVPLAVFERRVQEKAIAQAGLSFRRDDPMMITAYHNLYKGRHVLLFIARRILLLGLAILVLMTVAGWHRRRGELAFAGIDLGKSVVTVAMNGDRAWAVVTHSVIPAVFLLIYVLVGARPASRSRAGHLVGAALIALVVPGAVVLYLLTVLLVTAGVLRLRARVAAFARSAVARENRQKRVRVARWADYRWAVLLRARRALPLESAVSRYQLAFLSPIWVRSG